MKEIQKEMKHIKSFENREFIKFLENPEYGFNFQKLMKKFDIISLKYEYDNYTKWIEKEKEKDLDLWKRIRNLLRTLQVQEFTNTELKNEEALTIKITTILKEKFNEVEQYYSLGPSGKHVDILVEKKIAIELKIFRSDHDVDDVMGELKRDFEILNLNYGIAFGIDTHSNKYLRARHNQAVRGDDKIAFEIL